MRFYTLSSIILLSCSNAKSQKVGTKVEVNRNGEPITYYYESDKLISVVRKSSSISVDSSAVYYLNGGESEIHLYRNDGSGMKPKKMDDDATESGINIQNCSKAIKFNNKLGLLQDDFCYLNLLLPKLASDTKNGVHGDSISYKLDIGVGQLQGRGFSPFIYGTLAKTVKLIVRNNNLLGIYATFFDEPSGQTINYEKIYEYNKDETIKSTTTTNISTNKVEDSVHYNYSEVRLK